MEKRTPPLHFLKSGEQAVGRLVGMMVADVPEEM